MTGRSRAAFIAAALAITLIGPAAAQAQSPTAAREVLGKIKSVTPTTVVISHITTARAVKSSTLSYSIVGATLKSQSPLGKQISITLSYLHAGDIVSGYSAVSSAVTAFDELHGIPVPLKTLQDLTLHSLPLGSTLMSLAAQCELNSVTIVNVCGSFIWGGLSRINGTQLTIIAAGHKVKLSTGLALLTGGWPPVPITSSSLRLGETILVLSSATNTAIRNDVFSVPPVPVPVAVLYETG